MFRCETYTGRVRKGDNAAHDADSCCRVSCVVARGYFTHSAGATPCGRRLHRPPCGLKRSEWPDPMVQLHHDLGPRDRPATPRVANRRPRLAVIASTDASAPQPVRPGASHVRDQRTHARFLARRLSAKLWPPTDY
jgi:hypothetical protein